MGGKNVTPKEVIAKTDQDKQALDKAKKRNGAAYRCYNKKSLVELRFEHD